MRSGEQIRAAIEPHAVAPTPTSWKGPIAFAVISLVATTLFVGFARDGESTFRLSTEADLIQLPSLVLPARATGLLVASLLIAFTGWSAWRVHRGNRIRVWSVFTFAVLCLSGFLTWAAVGEELPVPGLLIGTVSLSVPLVFGALGGVISERVGVINVAIEGQLLAGAFVSAVVASVTGNATVGLLGAVVAGALVSIVLAAFSIKYLVDQVIVGVVLNVLVIGLTSFLYSQLLTQEPEVLNSPPRFPRVPIPLLSEIPIVGPALFRQTVIVYIAYIAVGLIFWGLFKTTWGLRLRAVGEHPQAADTVGVRVNLTRFWNVTFAGGIAGLGGAYFTLGSVGAFNSEMTAGAGFIALAAVIFGRWDPVRASLAALLFGFASNLQNVLGIIGSPVPSEFMLMLPYLVTMVAVAGLVGRVRGPAAAGKPYVGA